LELTRDEPIPLWSLEASQSNGSSVSYVHCVNDLFEDGMREIIIGRDDGTLEIYSYEIGNPVPQLMFEIQTS